MKPMRCNESHKRLRGLFSQALGLEHRHGGVNSELQQVLLALGSRERLELPDRVRDDVRGRLVEVGPLGHRLPGRGEEA
jgi:hypothetical protein